MMANNPKMTCPDCGVEMNHHANKLEYGNAQSEDDAVVFGGTVQEAHTCPECGKTRLRRSITN